MGGILWFSFAWNHLPRCKCTKNIYALDLIYSRSDKNDDYKNMKTQRPVLDFRR